MMLSKLPRKITTSSGRSAAINGERSGADPNRRPCTVASRNDAPSGRSGRRRNAPTIDPAEVPTMTSAVRAS